MINGQILANDLVILIHRAEHEYPPPLIKALANLATTINMPFVCVWRMHKVTKNKMGARTQRRFKKSLCK